MKSTLWPLASIRRLFSSRVAGSVPSVNERAKSECRARRRRQLGLAIEPLEDRRLLAAVLPTANEQFMLELINKARANPSGYSASLGIALNEGVKASDTISTTPKQPLAINPNLTDAAIKHSDWMLANDVFSHTGAGGTTITQRIVNSGYPLQGSWTVGENLGFAGSFPNVPDQSVFTKNVHENLFIDKDVPDRGHRVVMLKDVFREVGIGVRSGVFTQNRTDFNAVMVTQDFGKTGTAFFLTGVAYSDRVTADRFYTPGEGLSGVSIVAVRNSDGARFSTTTWASGGYSLPLEPGTYNVTASGTALGASQFFPGIVISDRNVKRDFVPGTNASAPEIEIVGGTTIIADGSTATSTASGTNFGSATIGGNGLTKSFTIRNHGNAALALSGSPSVTISGTNASDFVVTALPPGALAAGATATFSVRFSPTAVGVRTAKINVASNDVDESTYDFVIEGTATGAPAIRVTGNNVAIVDGDRTPAATDFTSFGDVLVNGGVATNTFAITNTGTSTLNLTGVNPVTLMGAQVADFRVTAQPAVRSLAPGQTTSFTVQFDASGMGNRNAFVMVSSDDPRITMHDFSIVGRGLAPLVRVSGNRVTIPDGDRTPTTADFTSFGTLSVNGDNLTRTYEITNTGTAPLSLTGATRVVVSGPHAADFTVVQPSVSVLAAGASTTFSIRFDPSAAGMREAFISIATNAADFPAYDFKVLGVGSAPAIVVQGNNVAIPDGDRTPTTADHTSFGDALVASGTVNRTFVVKNEGNAPLNLTGTNPVTILGGRVVEYRVIAQPTLRTLAPGASTSFTIQFDPVGMGNRSAFVMITSDDPRIAMHDFSIVGRGLAPMVRVTGNDVAIPDGDRTPLASDLTMVGSTAVTGGLIERTFQIVNTGTSTLTLTGTSRVVLSGTHAADFTVVRLPAATIAAGGSSSFTIRFDPRAVGVRSAFVSIATNAADFPAYDFMITGVGV